MKIQIVADTHTNFIALQGAINRVSPDIVIQLGDLGHFPNGGYFIPPSGFGVPFYFIDGNHEYHIDLQRRVKDNDLEVAKDVFYVPRGTRLEFDGVTFNCCGGAYSPDRAYRTEGVDWFKEEIPSYAEFDKFFSLPSSDYVLTHTAPEFVTQDLAKYKVIDQAAKTFAANVDSLNWSPKKWFFGHWHRHIERTVNGIDYMGLPCVHDHYYWGSDGKEIHLKGFDGYVIDTNNPL